MLSWRISEGKAPRIFKMPASLPLGILGGGIANYMAP